MTSAASRRRTLRQFISRDRIESQSELVKRLAASGYSVTQATVSRDLDAIGAIKRRSGNRAFYELATNGDGVDRELRRTLSQFVEDIEVTGNLVVLHTPPGAAHLVASSLDGSDIDGLLGTVAGDDTVFAAAAERVGGRGLARRLEEISS